MLLAIEAHLEGDLIKDQVQRFLHLGHEFCAAGVVLVLIHHPAQFCFHPGKGQLDRVVPRKKLRRDVRGHLIPVEPHEVSHGAVIGVPLIRQSPLDGGLGLFRQFLRLVQHVPHRVHGGRISSQFLRCIEEKGSPDSSER